MELPPDLSFTELPNSVTSDLDRAGSGEMVELFARCDRELFGGPESGPPGGLLHPEVIAGLISAARLFRRALPGKVVLSGAGTSGRLAFLLARAFREKLRSAGGKVIPLIAGGDLALVKAVEEAEDDVEEARRRARGALGGSGKALFVGITCGLSAPSVGGGLLEAFGRRETAVVLLGTNRPERARPVKLDEKGTTLKDLAHRAASSPDACLLAPLVGGEAVTGSTRLKCGSAAWLLNCNVPYHARRRAKGLKFCRAGLSRFDDRHLPAGRSADGRYMFRLDGVMTYDGADPNDDAASLRDGWVTVSLLHPSLDAGVQGPPPEPFDSLCPAT